MLLASPRSHRIALCATLAAFGLLLSSGCPSGGPESSGLQPTSGPTTGGTQVTVLGQGFQSGTAVLFGDRAAAASAVVNDQLITATSPPHEAGIVDVQLLSSGVSTALVIGQFEFIAEDSGKPQPEPTALLVESLWPVEGPAGGGTLVTLQGSGLPADVAVLFGAGAATDVQVINSSLLTARTPGGQPGAVNVCLRCAGGAEAHLPAAFTYLDDSMDGADGVDTDGDGLSDTQERLGYDIVVDGTGFGLDPAFASLRHVTSNPLAADTDDDGLDDCAELINRTDPSRTDTDGDELDDAAELTQWLTSPVSVDSDADARGPAGELPPNAALFDGRELYTVADLTRPPRQRVLRPSATSPSLADTDGDYRTDREELDDPVHHPLIADLPQLKVAVVDNVDIRLDVEYAEELGQESQYGTEFTTSTTTARSKYRSDTVSESLSIGVSHTFGLLSGGTTVSAEVTIGGEQSWGTTTESSATAEQSYSQYLTDARTRTETAASGSMVMGVQIENTGLIAFTLTDLAFTIRQWQPAVEAEGGSAGAFRTFAQLTPDFGDGISLAPGAKTPVLAVQAADINADRVKAFLAFPNSLYLEPAAFELRDAEGFNFAFINEVTFARTARIIIDFGGGVSEEYRVATNVDRRPDSTFNGVRLGTVLQDILAIPFETRPRRELQPGASTNERVLTRVRDADTVLGAAPSFWIVRGTGFEPFANGDFEDVSVHAGDEVLIFYCSDPDGDGLFGAEEQHFGSSDLSIDSDGDGLSDVSEVRARYIDESGSEVAGGWDVAVAGHDIYHVFSDPTAADQDDDGLNDAAEKAGGTDPTRPDTDRDGLSEAVDPFPTVPARPLFVRAAAAPGGDGSSWSTALASLDDALAAADSFNNNANPVDDVSEVWVAAGSYTPATSFTLVPHVAVYGGFTGSEDKLAQRNEDPLTNGVSLTTEGGTLVLATAAPDAPLVLDGFLLEGAASALRASNANVCVSHCLFFNNHAASADQPGPAAYIGTGTAAFAHCTFSNNEACYNGALGGAVYLAAAATTFSDCTFVGNEIPAMGTAMGGGAALCVSSGRADFVRCRFEQNRVLRCSEAGHGGAVALVNAEAVFRDCVFAGNQVEVDGPNDWWTEDYAGGGVAALEWSHLVLLNCVVCNNRAKHFGGGVYVSSTATADLLQCAFTGNTAYATGSEERWCLLFIGYIHAPFGVGAAVGACGHVNADNCIFWGNTADAFAQAVYPLPGEAREVEISPGPGQVDGFYACGYPPGGTIAVSNCCIRNGDVVLFDGSLTGSGNIAIDPSFEAAGTGYLCLNSDSPCIDAGNRFVDADPLTPGFQALPSTDIAGRGRITDGNGDGVAEVDMGACEYQP